MNRFDNLNRLLKQFSEGSDTLTVFPPDFSSLQGSFACCLGRAKHVTGEARKAQLPLTTTEAF